MKNVMEDVVAERLQILLKNVDCCKCDKCLIDMTARALNSLKPKYANTSSGELYSRANILNHQSLIDVDIEISKAISLVSSLPHH